MKEFTKRYSLLLAALLLSTLALVHAAQSFPMYPLFGFDSDGMVVGSKVATFSLPQAHYKNQNLMRKAVLIHFTEISQASLETILSKKPGAIAIILPNSNQNTTNEHKIWKAFYEQIGFKSNIIPIFFCFENPEIMKYYQYTLQQITDPELKDFKLELKSDEPKTIQKLMSEDYFALLDEDRSFRAGIPTVMLVASLDKFLPSPFFANDDAYSIPVFFNLMKQLKNVFKEYNKINQNILFYMCSSSAFNYEGLVDWFNKPENSKYSAPVETVILLDNILDKTNIQITYQSIPQAQTKFNFTDLVDGFQSAGFQVVSNQMASTKQLLNVTREIEVIKISDVEANAHHYLPVYDKQIQEMNIYKKMNALLKVLVMCIYENINYETDIQKYVQTLDLKELMLGYVKLLNSTPRFISFLHKDYVLNQRMKEQFKQDIPNYHINKYTLKNKKFYSQQMASGLILKYYDPFVNVYMFAGVLAWIGLIYLLFLKTNWIIKFHAE